MARPNLVKLPVHSGRALVINLHPVNAHVSRTGLWITGMHICQCDEAAAVLRPAFDDGKIVEREIVKR